MSVLHGMQAESELFRNGDCQSVQEEEDYEEYQRKMRALAKAKAPPPRRNNNSHKPAASSTHEPQPRSTQATLEDEHAARVEARARLEDREERLDALLAETLGGADAVQARVV